MQREADDPAERDQHGGDRQPDVEAVQRRGFGGRGDRARLARRHAAAPRAAERQPLGFGDGGPRRRASAASRRDAQLNVAANEAAIAAPTAAVPSRPATRATALLTPEAIPAWSLGARRAPRR